MRLGSRKRVQSKIESEYCRNERIVYKVLFASLEGKGMEAFEE